MTKRTYRLIAGLETLGFSEEEAWQLRRIEMTLRRWSELECGDGNDHCSWAIERDENTGKPFRCVYPHDGKARRYAIPDRETGALRRLKAIMEQHPDFEAYHQTDPRGCALYIIRKADIQGTIDSCYNRGMAVAS